MKFFMLFYTFASRQQVSNVQVKLFHDRRTLAPLAFKSRIQCYKKSYFFVT